MQDKAFPIAIFGLNFLVETNIFPVINTLWFALNQVASHGEISLGEIERIFEVLSHNKRAEAVEKRRSVDF